MYVHEDGSSDDEDKLLTVLVTVMTVLMTCAVTMVMTVYDCC